MKLKKITFLVLSFIIFELLFCTFIYYVDHKKPSYWFISSYLYRKWHELKRNNLIQSYKDHNDVKELSDKFFLDPQYESRRDKALTLYEKTFKNFLRQLEERNVKLFVLYLHSLRKSYPHDRDYFLQLCQKYHVSFIDGSALLNNHSKEDLYNLPYDDHLSHYGHIQVTKLLKINIQSVINHRSNPNHHSLTTHKRYGDSTPNRNFVFHHHPHLPYLVINNTQGLRRLGDVNPAKDQSFFRILCLGDSFTYGQYVHNHQTFSNLLEQAVPESRVYNGGVAGYSITDQVSLFEERAKHLNPDIVILQVLDNDLWDLINPLNRQMMSREHQK